MKHKVEFEEVLKNIGMPLHKACTLSRFHKGCVEEFEDQVKKVYLYMEYNYNFSDSRVLDLDASQIIDLCNLQCDTELRGISHIARQTVCIEAYRRICEDLSDTYY